MHIPGSLIGTEEDMNRRKIFAVEEYTTAYSIFDSEKIPNQIKLRTLDADGASAFPYNSELWTLTEKVESTNDAFQHGHLRKS